MKLSLLRIAFLSFKHSWKIGVSVALGVGVATAVIVGALLVGDSMRGSLRGLTLERLGRIEAMLYPRQFFDFSRVVPLESGYSPLIFFDKGVIEHSVSGQTVRRSGKIQIIGCDSSFWQMDEYLSEPVSGLEEDQVVLNQSAAEELGVSVGDLVTVRLPVEQAVPADSPLGKKEIDTEGIPRLKVVQIIADRGLGRFTLSASQAAPMNVFLSREMIASILDREGQANMVLFDRPVSSDTLSVDLQAMGMNLTPVVGRWLSEEGDVEEVFTYNSLTSNSLLLSEVVVNQILNDFANQGAIPQSTYLANAIDRLNEDGEVVATIPYSTITAVDSSGDLSLDFGLSAEQDAQDVVPVVLNEWAASHLQAQVGDAIRISYFEPEVEQGVEVESFFDAVVTSIVPLVAPDEPYRRTRPAVFRKPLSRYNDPDLTPTVPGVTDQASISDWDLPFKLTRDITKADDEYWNQYRLTPKLFLPLSVGRQYFGSRFGVVTGIRFPNTTASDVSRLSSEIEGSLSAVKSSLGWSVVPLKANQLASSGGTTPFDLLFLSLSFFVIAAAVLLIAMLFRLGLIQRMRQYGVLRVTGWSPADLVRYVLAEGFVTALVGVSLGAVCGVFYAMLILHALRTWWVGAVTVPFLEFHWSYRSLLIGSVLGLVISSATLWISTRWISRLSPQFLISGRNPDSTFGGGSGRRSALFKVVIGFIICSIGLAVLGAISGGQVAAGAFVGSGMSLLAGALVAQYLLLNQISDAIQNRVGAFCSSTRSLALRNISRSPLRSTMTVGLISSAAFLIFSISAFQLRPTHEGTGGFELIGEAAQPLFDDLDDFLVREQLFGTDASKLSGSVVAMFRQKVGQDASCNNLYQATEPTVLGVPDSFSQLMSQEGLEGFSWAAGSSESKSHLNWDALGVDASGMESDPIPIVLDQNTAMWSLQMMKGLGEVKQFEFTEGRVLFFKVVGLLSNSVLQGKILMGESNFESVFPEVNGYQYFMVACDPKSRTEVQVVMESRLGDVGMDLSDASVVLSKMLAVQNTYLKTFQSLGAIGLLLGTIGLGIAQLRSVLERQNEFAILRSMGFPLRRLGALVVRETLLLLIFGVLIGLLCAILAVLPHALVAGINPPLMEPAMVSLGIVLIGLIASLVSVRQVVKLPLLDTLRREIA